MKKLFIVTIIVCLFCSVLTFSACDNTEEYRVDVVVTIFPEYDWVKNICKDVDGIGITMLLDNGIDLHNYQPTVKDIAKIANCDVFIYVGGESDSWVEDALTNAVNTNMQAINLMDVLAEHVKEEEIVDGMQGEGNDGDDEGETEYDEHVWLSLNNAKICCNAIAQALCNADPTYSTTYQTNTANYVAQIDQLHSQYTQSLDNTNKDTIVCGDRFPFRYLVDDYGINYFAAFVGCSAESEASFETIVFLANKVDQLQLNAIITTETTNKNIAQTIKQNTTAKNQSILTLNSMQSITSNDVTNGATYLQIMQNNLAVLTTALQ